MPPPQPRPPPQARAAQRPRESTTCRIEDFKYVPSTITVAPGTTITWTNRDKAPHTATSGASPNADGVFESGTITKGASRTVTVSKRGTFAYYCAFHPFMKGTVIVK